MLYSKSENEKRMGIGFASISLNLFLYTFHSSLEVDTGRASYPRGLPRELPESLRKLPRCLPDASESKKKHCLGSRARVIDLN